MLTKEICAQTNHEMVSSPPSIAAGQRAVEIYKHNVCRYLDTQLYEECLPSTSGTRAFHSCGEGIDPRKTCHPKQGCRALDLKHCASSPQLPTAWQQLPRIRRSKYVLAGSRDTVEQLYLHIAHSVWVCVYIYIYMSYSLNSLNS